MIVTADVPCVLSDELELFRESVRSFAQTKLAAGYLERARCDEFPPGFYRELAAQGLIGLEVGRSTAGRPRIISRPGIAVEEIARADFNAAYLIFSLDGHRQSSCSGSAHWLAELLPRSCAVS